MQPIKTKSRQHRYSLLLKAVVLSIIFSVSSGLFAQTGKELRKHVIIAIDQYPERNFGYVDVLHDRAIMIPRICNILDTLLTPIDYVSVVNYGLGTNDRSFDAFTTCVTRWEQYEPFRQIFSQYWPQIAYESHTNEGEHFSMLTGAKFYSFHSLFGCNKDGDNNQCWANRTFLLMITDNQYNGGDDMDAEFVHFMDNGAYFNPYLKRDEFVGTCIKISRAYNFVHQGEQIIKDNHLKPYKAILFEVIPNSSFSLGTAVVYPANLGLHRIRGGYRIDFDYRSISPSYRLRRLEVESKGIKTAAYSGEDGHVSVEIKASDVGGVKQLNVELRGWLEQVDDIYSGLILNPYDPNFSGLNVSVTLSLDDSHKLFGIFALPDVIWWWYPEDPATAVLIWDAIILALLLTFVTLLVIYLIRKYIDHKTRYVPSDNAIKISHI